MKIQVHITALLKAFQHYQSLRITVPRSLLALVCFISMVGFTHTSYANSQPLILSGKVSSSAKQVVVAPRASRWQIQIQWMAEEGVVVNAGELVAVFDGATEQALLEQTQERLEALELEYQQLEMSLNQEYTEAEGRLKVAKMLVDRAKIPVSVTSDTITEYQRGQDQLALERALMEQIKAAEALEKSKKQRISGLAKKQLDIDKAKEDIVYYENLLTKLNVVAQHTGPVTYSIHPWYGTKVKSGMNVQPSWKVLDVQASTDFIVESFVHEIDAIQLSQGQSVDITFDAFPGEAYTGEITKISSQAENKPQLSNAAYFPVEISFRSLPKRTLYPGMSVRITPEQVAKL
ncbi:HlyD family secretion protein [Opacimonas viscosa]|uniref:HlyD family secretion protein n=1 Tax=Opacimonas viscosa TaxID=2961944 RepID=A0AA41X237_9ALTE|nr:HlyD family efflux transporter periplasmic adaptor subunit [Opacimonas viscosa]MCP3428068.1 HlyD family secretion protein [Opacimonas viscosa]